MGQVFVVVLLRNDINFLSGTFQGLLVKMDNEQDKRY